MAKYQAYPEYKDSEVEWLGEVPKHWSVFIGKRIFQSVRTPALKNDEQLAASQKYGVIPQLLMMQLNDSKVMLALKGTDSFRHVEENDFVISLRSFEGGIEHSKYSGCVSPAYTVLKNVKPISYGYYRYLLKCAPFIAALQSSTDSLRDGKSINYEQFGAINLPFTSICEQNIIAAFLDHETAKIDNLIEKQQQLIELLKEKRQAVISHAVTKGLNPNVPMKDSGVEWLGEVPDHWSVMHMRHAIVRIEQGKSPECEARNADVEEWGVLKSGCVNGGRFNQKEHKALPTSIKPNIEYEVRPGDLIMSRASGSVDLIGSMAFIYNCRERLLLSDKTFRVIPVKKIFPEFLSLLMGSLPMRNQIKLAINGAEGLANNITKESIKSFYIVAPCFSEQIEIVDFLNKKNKAFDQLEIILSNSLMLLQERRTALISAAVTGKIDVRNWVAPEAREAEVSQEATV